MHSIHTNFARLLMACLVVALCLVPTAHAQQSTVSVRVAVPQRIYLGDTVDLTVAVTGSREVEPPDLSGVKDFDIVYRAPLDSSSTMTTIINGRMSTNVNINFSHLYALTPRRAGQFEFPAISVTINGRTYTTTPVPIEVLEPKQSPDFSLTVSSSASEAYVGEPIVLKLTWTLGKDVRDAAFSLPVSGPEYDSMPGPLTRSLTGNERGGAVQLRLNGQPVAAILQGNVVTVDRVIIPSKPGVLSIGPARVDFLAVIGQRDRRPFDSFFEDRAITDRQYAAAPLVVIPINDLPAAGKPSNFSGLVGTYNITAAVDTTTVSVGDPINLSVAVSGPFPLTLVPALDLSHQSSLSRQFRLPREPALPQLSTSAATFISMIRARNADVKEIGPISLTYFDPESKSYKTASTKPIPLTVRASATVTLPDLPDDATPATEPERRPGGLPDIERSAPSLTVPTFSIASTLGSTRTVIGLGLLPLACFITWGFVLLGNWRDRDPAAARRRSALARLRRDLRRSRSGAQPIDAFARALSNFAADSFDEPRDTLTGTRAASLLSSTKTSSGVQLAELLHACDESRFGIAPSPRNNDTLAQQAIDAARTFTAQFRPTRPEMAPS